MTVKVTRLEGAEGLRQALLERGITADITYLPEEKVWQPGRYAAVPTPGLTLSVGADMFKVEIPAGAVGPTDTFVLSAAVTPFENGSESIVAFGITDGPVAPCVMVDAP